MVSPFFLLHKPELTGSESGRSATIARWAAGSRTSEQNRHGARLARSTCYSTRC